MAKIDASFTLNLSIFDVDALHAAALAHPDGAGQTLRNDDGSISIGACLVTLLDPGTLAGCKISDSTSEIGDDEELEHCDKCGNELEPMQIGRCSECRAVTWLAGWNVPGYLPDGDSFTFETADEAKRFLITEIKRAEDSADNEDVAEELAAFAEEFNLHSGEFGMTCNGVHYWITKGDTDHA